MGVGGTPPLGMRFAQRYSAEAAAEARVMESFQQLSVNVCLLNSPRYPHVQTARINCPHVSDRSARERGFRLELPIR
jgi:hypothetical protein